MTVAEFVEIFNYNYKYNIPLQFTYKGVKKSLYTLSKINDEFEYFKLEISLSSLNDDSFSIYSNRYDLDELNKHDKQFFETLKIEYPETSFTYIIIIHIM